MTIVSTDMLKVKTVKYLQEHLRLVPANTYPAVVGTTIEVSAVFEVPDGWIVQTVFMIETPYGLRTGSAAVAYNDDGTFQSLSTTPALLLDQDDKEEVEEVLDHIQCEIAMLTEHALQYETRAVSLDVVVGYLLEVGKPEYAREVVQAASHFKLHARKLRNQIRKTAKLSTHICKY